MKKVISFAMSMMLGASCCTAAPLAQRVHLCNLKKRHLLPLQPAIQRKRKAA